MHISIEKVTGNKELADLESAWKLLFSKSDSSPFLSWEWLTVWLKHFGAKKSPYILKAVSENEVIGILPLFIEKGSFLGMQISKLGIIGEEQGGADYLDLIAAEANRLEISNAIADFLMNQNDFDKISVDYVRKDSSIALILDTVGKSKAKNRGRYTANQKSISPQVLLNQGSESVLRNSRRFSNFKRRLKQLEKIEGFEFRSITLASEMESAFERFFDLHEKRWENCGGSELSGHPKLSAFQRVLVSNMAGSNMLRFDELWVEGECRASIYGMDDGHTFYYYNAGYDLEWSKMSVGLVLIGLSIKYAAERGNAVYDFLRGEETYKFDWSNENTELFSVDLIRPTFATAIESSIDSMMRYSKKLAKDALPNDISEKIQRIRRRWKRNYNLSDANAEEAI